MNNVRFSLALGCFDANGEAQEAQTWNKLKVNFKKS